MDSRYVTSWRLSAYKEGGIGRPTVIAFWDALALVEAGEGRLKGRSTGAFTQVLRRQCNDGAGTCNWLGS